MGILNMFAVRHALISLQNLRPVLKRLVNLGQVEADEVDLENGFLMVPAAVPVAPASVPGPTPPGPGPTPPGPGPIPPGPGLTPPGQAPGVRTNIRISFPATRDLVFKSFQAIANLADKSDGARVRIRIEGSSAAGFDPSWLRNAVDEPLDAVVAARVIAHVEGAA